MGGWEMPELPDVETEKAYLISHSPNQTIARTQVVDDRILDEVSGAGVGNVYSDEILFQCGLHPETRTDEIDRDAVTAICTSMRRILRTAARNQARKDQLPDGWLLPQREKDEPCPKCGIELDTLDISGRTACYCPNCQRRP